MMLHAWAPSTNDPPPLYSRWTWVKELGIPWEKSGITDDELPILAELVSIKNEAEKLKSGKPSGRVNVPTTI